MSATLDPYSRFSRITGLKFFACVNFRISIHANYENQPEVLAAAKSGIGPLELSPARPLPLAGYALGWL